MKKPFAYACRVLFFIGYYLLVAFPLIVSAAKVMQH
jgi:hypothetical protein